MGARKSVATKHRAELRTAVRGEAAGAARRFAVRSGPARRLGSSPGGRTGRAGGLCPRPPHRSGVSPAWGGRGGAAEGARDRPLPGRAAGGRCREARRRAAGFGEEVGGGDGQSPAATARLPPASARPGRAGSAGPARWRGAGCAQGPAAVGGGSSSFRFSLRLLVTV